YPGTGREDEVSLRDLYLTFRSGLLLIMVVALIFAVGAFLFVTSRGLSYRAAATVAVTPPAVGTTALSGFELSIPTGIDFDAYRELAYDVDLIESALRQVQPPIVTTTWTDADIIALLGRLTVTSRATASQVRGHLLVEHAVTSGSSAEDIRDATAVANAWAGATATAAARLITEPVDAALTLLKRDFDGRKASFDTAAAEWSEFVGIDERRSLNEKLDAVTSLDSARRVRLAELENAVAAATARLDALRSASANSS